MVISVEVACDDMLMISVRIVFVSGVIEFFVTQDRLVIGFRLFVTCWPPPPTT